ncbi:MAG TPA: hypothetical protein PKY05_12925, partial [Fibrobacteria bacterium]|nr:hypothetical protein [Fibrobacteria bacterium]
DGAGFLWRAGHESEVLRRMSVSGVEFTPGVQYVAASIDRQWAVSLCGNVGKLSGEGVDWVVVPMENGRMDPLGEEFAAFPMDSLRVGSVCSSGRSDSVVTNAVPR